MITQQQFVEVLSDLTEEDFKEAQKLVEQLGELFEDTSLRNKFDEDKLNFISDLIDDKYSEEVTIAMLVSKFK